MPVEKIRRIRVLIVGKANAGKTTILQRICNSIEEPEIYDGRGQKVNSTVIGTTERGYHDINHEMVFKSNPKFIFHDSCGFEAGHEDEFETVKRFITERANAVSLEERIHVIWYCIPMTHFHRAITVAEERFFGECDTRNVTVVVLFTQFDALLDQAFQPEDLLRASILPPEYQVWFQRERAEDMFTKKNIWGELCNMRFPPRAFLKLESMDESDTGCEALLEQTVAVLDDQALQMLAQDTERLPHTPVP